MENDPMTNWQWPDARGWVGLACFFLVIMVLWMIAAFPALRNDEFFKLIATAIIITAWVNGPVGWAYQATKGGGELADKNAAIVEQAAAAANGNEPKEVKVVNEEPIDVNETASGELSESEKLS